MEDIVVLGFGRSGTTWVSDIISKITGRLILFEPFHPSVTELSEKFSYSFVASEKDSDLLKDYLNKVRNKQHRKMWLMRNHVPVSLDKISAEFLNILWEESSVIGFKEIRGNFMIRWFKENLDAKIVFITRHPCAVVSSLKNRSNFWEFGWPGTYETFLDRTIYNNYFKDHKIAGCIGSVENAKTDIEKYAVMWAITHAISLPELEGLGVPLFYYEDIYNRPFSNIRQILDYLEIDSSDIHPSHIFTPSMTTLKTIHGLHKLEENALKKGAAFFWDNVLSDKEVGMIMDIVRAFGIYIYDKRGFPVKQYREQ